MSQPPEHAGMTLAQIRRLPPALSVPQAGEIVGLCRASAYAAARSGELPTLRLGRRVVVPTAALLRMLGIEAVPDAA